MAEVQPRKRAVRLGGRPCGLRPSLLHPRLPPWALLFGDGRVPEGGPSQPAPLSALPFCQGLALTLPELRGSL